MKIKCGYCHKVVEIDKNKIRKSGKAEIITCNYCARMITISFNNEKYYEEEIKE